MLRYREYNGRIAVLRGISLLHCRSNNNIGNIGNAHCGIAVHLYQCAAKFIDIACTSHSTQVVLVAIVAHHARTNVYTHCSHGALKLTHCNTVHLHLYRVGKHLILLVVAANDCHIGYTACCKHGRLHNPLGKSAQLHH